MHKKQNHVQWVGTLLLAGLLAGCSSAPLIGSRQAPDDFAVVEAPPLSLPPSFTLRPPVGHSTNLAEPQVATPAPQAAQQILTGTAPAAGTAAATSATHVEPSQDVWLLDKAGAQNIDPDIRSELTPKAPAKPGKK